MELHVSPALHYDADVLVLGADLHPEHIFIGGKEL